MSVVAPTADRVGEGTGWASTLRRLDVSGRAVIGWAEREGRTRLADLYQHDPLRVFFPAPALGDLPTAVLVTTSGGLVGGDRLEVSVSAGAGASALVTAQAAEKIYRSAGADCLIDIRLRAEAGAWLEWLPQETIVFDRARFRRRVAVDIDMEARILAGEMLVLGRTAMGEAVTEGRIRDEWEVRRGGRLIWADRLRLEGDLAGTILRTSCLDGARAIATALYAAPDAAAALATARPLVDAAEDGVRAGCTVLGGLLIARWIGRDALAVRVSFAAFWAGFRHAVADLPAVLPRLWHI